MHTVARLRDSERGYNLVEVLIAMALMGTVLMSIMGLFYFGRRNVYSGKEMTEAVAVATHVREDLSAMTKAAALAAFGLGAATTGTTNTVAGQTFSNSFVRTTTSISATTDPTGNYLTKWQNEMVNDSKFQNGVVTLVLIPDKDPLHGTAQLKDASVVRIRVFVTWGEAVRTRQVVLDVIKLDHSAGT